MIPIKLQKIPTKKKFSTSVDSIITKYIIGTYLFCGTYYAYSTVYSGKTKVQRFPWFWDLNKTISPKNWLLISVSPSETNEDNEPTGVQHILSSTQLV